MVIGLVAFVKSGLKKKDFLNKSLNAHTAFYSLIQALHNTLSEYNQVRGKNIDSAMKSPEI